LQPKALAAGPALAELSRGEYQTLSPGEVRFETEASITPVPEQASTSTSFSADEVFHVVRHANSARKSAVRWCAVKDAMAVCAAGSNGVGPGVKRRFLRSIVKFP